MLRVTSTRYTAEPVGAGANRSRPAAIGFTDTNSCPPAPTFTIVTVAGGAPARAPAHGFLMTTNATTTSTTTPAATAPPMPPGGTPPLPLLPPPPVPVPVVCGDTVIIDATTYVNGGTPGLVAAVTMYGHEEGSKVAPAAPDVQTADRPAARATAVALGAVLLPPASARPDPLAPAAADGSAMVAVTIHVVPIVGFRPACTAAGVTTTPADVLASAT